MTCGCRIDANNTYTCHQQCLDSLRDLQQATQPKLCREVCVCVCRAAVDNQLLVMERRLETALPVGSASPVFTGVSRPPIDSRSGVSRRADSAGPRASSSGWVGGGLTGRPSGMVLIGARAVPVRDTWMHYEHCTMSTVH